MSGSLSLTSQSWPTPENNPDTETVGALSVRSLEDGVRIDEQRLFQAEANACGPDAWLSQ